MVDGARPGPPAAVDGAWLRSYLANEARRSAALRFAVGRALVEALARSAPAAEVAELVERLDADPVLVDGLDRAAAGVIR